LAELHINNRFDTLEAQRRAKLVASAVGFPSRACSELAIVASELSSNILKYGKCGRMAFVEVKEGEGIGISIRAYDAGPPFRDLGSALLDGCDDRGPIDADDLSRRGGLGAGLGAVIRLTHSFRVEQDRPGKWVIATRYLGRPLPPFPPSRR
jgi:anti-sigma regulatory factor (Ser/Thr protein kinase)